ncbi:unnamed protein product [Didymodactylos carnosus]|uniref:Sulfotransferase n=1 Tax=Didymodactylos carnosus TaxID=1234261 RepID=A0A815QLM1_9BILA|nr:unnamed protein product [Didymodactylos carnosus]CAF4334212.1 unnamed protein product [Didymodactylos carnosus]
MFRTGTTSLKNALEILGIGKGYYEVMINEHLGDHPGYSHASASPVLDFYRELMKFYSKAKFILTCRDEEKWHASIVNTVNL